MASAVGTTFATALHNPSPGGGVVCVYMSGDGSSADVAIFAHSSPSVFAGQVANAPGNPAMPSISGVGDGAYGQDNAGRSIVNAYSNSSHTMVAAQATGPLTAVEAFARIALSDNS
ncbi:MAG TPA: hypothetical protein VEJ44_04145 [Acidimicrobiales bacterium]|nr:hypothetical protein [Acidimicrobiales bacterium]